MGGFPIRSILETLTCWKNSTIAALLEKKMAGRKDLIDSVNLNFIPVCL